MIDKDRALTLLGNGLGPTEVATTLGCDTSYISQLLMDDSFRAQVLALRIENLQAATKRDKKIDSLEDELIHKLEENIRYMTKTTDIMRAFAIVNAAKRRGAVTAGEITINQNIVAIQLPPAARNMFLTNAQGEVVDVDGTPTTTMPLQNLLRQRLVHQKQSQENKDEDGITGEAVRASQGEKAAA